jgi:hypothetical protein
VGSLTSFFLRSAELLRARGVPGAVPSPLEGQHPRAGQGPRGGRGLRHRRTRCWRASTCLPRSPAASPAPPAPRRCAATGPPARTWRRSSPGTTAGWPGWRASWAGSARWCWRWMRELELSPGEYREHPPGNA